MAGETLIPSESPVGARTPGTGLIGGSFGFLMGIDTGTPRIDYSAGVNAPSGMTPDGLGSTQWIDSGVDFSNFDVDGFDVGDMQFPME